MYELSTLTTCISHKESDLGWSRRPKGVPDNPTLSITVPVYNNAASLPQLHERLVSTLRATGLEHEIIYANDGSTDNSYEVLTGLRGVEGRVKVLDLVKNYGQSAAILAAISKTNGDIIVTIDADLQNHPEDIPALVAGIRNGADFACGIRLNRRDSLLTRRGPSWLVNQLVGHALGVNLRDWGCGLNAVTSVLAMEIFAQNPPPGLPKAEVALMASRIAQIEVGHSEREHGRSEYTAWRLLCFSAGFLRSFSIRRSFSRLFTRLTTGNNLHAPGSMEEAPGTFSGAGEKAAAVLAWTVLAGAAAIVQLGALFYRSTAADNHYRIREILE
ncbi:MAG: glycosyltransferase family 2 protein [Gammaproteobacteria bacterium (ex Lamellibrachia satsuma)]|nr:MAG: glycosyltransferase family 2 protein [Gammaproteobacteria bacterium (ex Lamellibrachia satsuma)]